MSTRFKKNLPPNCNMDGKYARFRKQINKLSYSFQLGPAKDISGVYQKYQQVLKLINSEPETNTLFWLKKKYFISKSFKKLAPSTQSRYLGVIKFLEHKVEVNGSEMPLGDLYMTEINKPLIKSIMHERLDEYIDQGLKGNEQVIYEKSVLSTLLTWACSNLTDIGITNNPILKIKLEIEKSQNERYVTDKEYLVQYDLASPIGQCFFEVTYLCASRGIEARHLLESNDFGDKLLIERRKGSKDTFIRVSDRLRVALDQAKSLRPKRKIVRIGVDRHIFENQKGNPFTHDSFQSMMGRLRDKMKKVGLQDVYWNMHLLKSKGLSDAKDKDMAGLTEQMKRRYQPKAQEHDAVD